MNVSIYKSTTQSDLYGFTPPNLVGNLPSQLGPWKHFKDRALVPGIIGVDPEEAKANIAKDGYHVGRAGVTIKVG